MKGCLGCMQQVLLIDLPLCCLCAFEWAPEHSGHHCFGTSWLGIIEIVGSCGNGPAGILLTVHMSYHGRLLYMLPFAANPLKQRVPQGLVMCVRKACLHQPFWPFLISGE